MALTAKELAHRDAMLKKFRTKAEGEGEAGASTAAIVAKMADFVQEWTDVPAVVRAARKADLPLDELVEDYLSISRQVKELESRKRGLSEDVKRLMIKSGVDQVLVNGAKVTKYDSHSARLDKQALVKAHGIKVLEWLEEATVRTPTTGVRITPKGEKERGE